MYQKLTSEGIEVLYDDREVSAGIKLADSDLIGCPSRIIISSKTLENNKIEFKERSQKEPQFLSLEEVLAKLR